MRQLLMLGFYCEVYRREPLCRVYVNDVLADEFNIPHTPKIDAWTPDMKLDPAFWSPEQYQLQSDPPFFKLLELDDAGEKFIDIRVEIQNSDNNYANGFMTRYSRVMFRQCWLAPVKIWERFDQILDRWKYSLKNWHKWQNNPAHYFAGLRNRVFDNLALHSDMNFPGITQQTESKEQQDLPQYYKECPNEHWTGTSGHFHLTLAKKLGFWRHSTDRRRGWWKLSLIKNVKDIYDKYIQYEDPRNTNQ